MALLVHSKDIQGVIADTVSISKIPALTGQEGERAEWMALRLREMGWTAHRDLAGNVLAFWQEQPRHPLAVIAHLDTAAYPAGKPRIEKDGCTVTGPGVADNGLGLAGLLAVARHFSDHCAPLLLACTVGGQDYSSIQGTNKVLEHERPLELITIEGDGLHHLVNAGPGTMRLVLELHLKEGFSPPPRLSALHSMIEILQQIGDNTECESWNVQTLEGGELTPSHSCQAQAQLEFRDHDAWHLIHAEKTVHAALEWLPEYLNGTLTRNGFCAGGSTDPQSPLIRDAIWARAETGLKNELVSAHTDGLAAYARNIPAVGVGLARAEAMHTAYESVDLNGLGSGLQALFELIELRLAEISCRYSGQLAQKNDAATPLS